MKQAVYKAFHASRLGFGEEVSSSDSLSRTFKGLERSQTSGRSRNPYASRFNIDVGTSELFFGMQTALEGDI